MTTTGRSYTRRRFLSRAAASSAAVALGQSGRTGAEDSDRQRNRKMILSFYCDDMSPRVAGAEAFETGDPARHVRRGDIERCCAGIDHT